MNKWRVAAQRCALLGCEAVFHFPFTIFHAIFLCFLIENFYLACLAGGGGGWRGGQESWLSFSPWLHCTIYLNLSACTRLLRSRSILCYPPPSPSILHLSSPPLPLRSGWNGSFSWLMANNCKYLIHNKAIKIKLKFSLCARRAQRSCCWCCRSPRCCCLLLLSSLSLFGSCSVVVKEIDT